MSLAAELATIYMLNKQAGAPAAIPKLPLADLARSAASATKTNILKRRQAVQQQMVDTFQKNYQTSLQKAGMVSAAVSDEKLHGLRQEFETAAEKERLLRRHSKWWNDTAHQRAVDNDTSFMGYVGSGAERLLPIPHTGTEALFRLPLVGAGAIAGHTLGAKFETLESDKIHRALRPAKLEKDLAPVLNAQGLPVTKLRETPLTRNLKLVSPTLAQDPVAIEALLRADPDVLGEALRKWDVPGLPISDKVKALRTTLGNDNLPIIRKEIKNILGQEKATKSVLDSVASTVRPWRLGGALLGAAGASVLTGLPLAARALWQKSRGGESSVRARDESKARLEEAERLANLRQHLVERAQKL